MSSEDPLRPPRSRSQSKLMRNKQKVIDEMIDTETSYIHHLDILLKLFVDRMNETKLINPSQNRVLFGEVRSIRLVNQVLCEHFLKGEILEAFMSLTPFLKLYSSYARNYPGSQTMLQKLMKTKSFDNFVVEQEDQPEMQGLKLPALLIMPIQRIPRYKLLLQQMLRYSHEQIESDRIQAILYDVQKVAEFVNECIGDYDHSLKIIALQQSLDSCAPKLLIPGRRFIKDGWLRKRDPEDVSRSVDRCFWLFNDIVIYGKRINNKQQFSTSCVLPLRHCSIQKVPGCNCFHLCCKGETLYLCHDDYTEFDDWFTQLDEAIKAARSDRQTLRKESSRRIPLRGQLLARAKRKSSSISDKLKNRTRQRNMPENSGEESEGLRRRLMQGVHHIWARKRKSPDSTYPTVKRRRENTAGRAPALSTINENVHSPLISSSSTCRTHWWEEETNRVKTQPSQTSNWGSFCSIM